MTGNEYIIGIDIGGTNIRIGLVSREKELKEFRIESTQKILQTEKTLGSLIEFIGEYIAEAECGDEIAGISMGFPSILDKARKKVVATTNIDGLDDIEVVDEVEEALKLPVFIDKDVNMLMQYDMFEKRIPSQGITTGFYIGTGLGNAISINGEVLIGKNGAAAELGHIPARGIKGECGCGNTACVELYASGKHLCELCEKELDGVFIEEVFEKYGDSSVIKEFIGELAVPVATEINILDPDYVIIGGGVVQMSGFPKQMLEQAIRTNVRKPYPEENLKFMYSVEGQENGVIGAGVYGFKKLEAVKKRGG